VGTLSLRGVSFAILLFAKRYKAINGSDAKIKDQDERNGRTAIQEGAAFGSGVKMDKFGWDYISLMIIKQEHSFNKVMPNILFSVRIELRWKR
jgi:hypothetical protein